MDANVQGLMGGVYLRYLFSCPNSGGLLWPSINSRMPSWSSPPPFCSRSATTAASTEITPIPTPQQKSAPKPIPNGNCVAIRASIDAVALKNSDDDKVIDEEEYDFFRELPNPDPEDCLPRDICGDFIPLFVGSRKCQREYSKERKIKIFYEALTVDRRSILATPHPKLYPTSSSSGLKL